MRGVDREFSVAGYFAMEVLCDRLRVTSNRPYGTFRLSNLYPGLRPGLISGIVDSVALILLDKLVPRPIIAK
jgi:hypothetical protein